MKQFIISCIVVLVGLSSAVYADSAVSPYGNVWANLTKDTLQFQQATLGVKASLGGSTAADVAYDAASQSLYTAKASLSVALPGDSLSIGLQAPAYEAVLDSQLGESALICLSCGHVKSAIYSASGLSLEANEGQNYSGTYSIAVVPGLKVAGSAVYDHPSDKWQGKGAVLGSYNVVSGLLYGSYTDATKSWDYGAAATVSLAQLVPGAGLFGKYAKGGALAAGPTYQASKGLQLAALALQDTAGADVHGEVRLTANF